MATTDDQWNQANGNRPGRRQRRDVVTTPWHRRPGRQLHDSTALLDSLPELDSLAVVQLVYALEERFGLTINDDEVTADVFETMGSLTRFIEASAADDEHAVRRQCSSSRDGRPWRIRDHRSRGRGPGRAGRRQRRRFRCSSSTGTRESCCESASSRFAPPVAT